MFSHDVRAESHGCMRVQDAPKYAEVLARIARPDEQWTAQKVRGMYGNTEHEVSLESVPIWIHLTYQTAFVDDAGRLQTRRDLYNLDSRTLAAIKSARAIPDPASEQKHGPEVAARARSARASAAPAPAAHAHRRGVAHRAPQVDAYPTMFFSNGVRSTQSRPQPGALYR
jgi:hypothetical protein